MRTSRGIALRIAAVYAVAAALWILLSGWWATGLPKPLEGAVELGKGLLFVAATSVLLYYTISRWTDAVADESRRADQALRKLQQVVDTVPAGVVLLDARGTVTFVNPFAGAMLGVSPKDSIGRPLEELLGAQHAEESAVAVGELLAKGSLDGLVLKGPHEQTQRALSARAADIDPSVPGSGWIVALADYSATHAELTRSARLIAGYRCLAGMAALVAHASSTEQLMEQVCELAVDTGGFAAAWAMAEGPDGRPREVGRCGMSEQALSVARRMSEGDDSEAQRMLDLAAGADMFVDNDLPGNAGKPWQDLARGSGYGSCVMFGIVERGRLRAGLALFASTVGFFDAAEKRLVAALKDDIALALDRLALEEARLHAERALAESAEDYRRLFDANPQPMYVHDAQTLQFLAVNDAALAKYGYTREQFEHLRVLDLRPVAEVPQLVEYMQRAPAGERLTDAGYWTHRDSAGREFPVHTYTHAITWDGHRAVLVLVDEVAKMG